MTVQSPLKIYITEYPSLEPTISMNFQQIIEERILTVQKLWAENSDETLRQPYRPGKWSRKELLGHLIDSTQNNIRRLILVQYEPTPHIIYEQETWVQMAGYQDMDKEELLTLWTLLCRHFVRVVGNLPEESLSRTLNISKTDTPDTYTTSEIIQYYVTHLDHHLEDLNQTT